MNVVLREPTGEDAAELGRIVFDAFGAIAEQHRFPPDFPALEMAMGMVGGLLDHPGFYGVVAELDGRVVGSNFLDERSRITGLGPITVDPAVQDRTVGRRLMEYMLTRVRDDDRPGVRLLQATWHNRSLCLYTKLGFDTRALLSNIQGQPLNLTIPGCSVRPATADDLAACDALCMQVHGHDRHGELADAVAEGTATAVEQQGRIVGYASSVGFLGHAVAEHNAALKALIGAAPSFFGPGFILPTTNGDVLRWCLSNGLRLVQPLTLMTIGEYQAPAGPYMPSILY
jgi:GNAT superfamily N-acetyltransferase